MIDNLVLSKDLGGLAFLVQRVVSAGLTLTAEFREYRTQIWNSLKHNYDI